MYAKVRHFFELEADNDEFCVNVQRSHRNESSHHNICKGKENKKKSIFKKIFSKGYTY